MVYALTVVAALVVATGEVIQQRSASQAPPEDNLSPKLLLWLVQRPRWLAGVACSLVGNLAFATAVGKGGVVLVEAVFAIRLVFGLTIAAVWRWHRIPRRDVASALLLTLGLIAFIVAARPHGSGIAVPDLRWAYGAGSGVAFAILLAVVAARLPAPRKALLLGMAAGTLFGIQASLVQSAVHVLTGPGIVALLTGWHPYAVIVVALLGLLLVQSAFEVEPLTASYPGVVTFQLLSAIAIGVFVLGGVLRAQLPYAGVLAAALVAMLVGMVALGRSPLVTGQHGRDSRARSR
jgi:hypothetical protein